MIVYLRSDTGEPDDARTVAILLDQDGTQLMTAGPTPPALLAISGAIQHTHTATSWERIRWALRFLLLGLCLGALTTTTVIVYQDYIQPRIGAQP